MNEPTQQNNPELLSKFTPEQLKAALDLKQEEVKDGVESQVKPVSADEKKMEQIREAAENIKGNAFTDGNKAEVSTNQPQAVAQEINKDQIISDTLHNGQLLKKDGTPTENLNELLNSIQ